VTRALPLSLVAHVVFLTLFALFASFVPQPHYRPQRVVHVRLGGPPQAGANIAAGVHRPSPPTPPVERTPAEPRPDLPPKAVPQETRREERPEPAPPPSQGSARAGSGAGSGGAAGAAAGGGGGGPGVSGTDVDFPFGWYLDRVQGIIASRWNPHELGFREGAQRRCVVHFFVDRQGRPRDVALTESSGVSVFDREALRAVKDAGLPPLPAQFPAPALGVSFVFTLEPGL